MLTPAPGVLRSATAADGAYAPRGGDARTLYVSRASCQRVDAAGDALVVSAQRPDEPLRRLRFPLARVARVVSSPAVDWSGAALPLCLRHHVNVCWLDQRGQALGSLHSHQPHGVGFATALDVLLETAEGLACYQNWLRIRRMRVLLQWGGAGGATIAPREWAATKRSWVYLAQLAPHLPPALQGLMAGIVAMQLQQCRLLPVQCGPAGEPVPLAQDLTWLLWAEMNLCCGPLADQAGGAPETALVFERWQARNASALVLHLQSLRRLATRMLRSP